MKDEVQGDQEGGLHGEDGDAGDDGKEPRHARAFARARRFASSHQMKMPPPGWKFAGCQSAAILRQLSRLQGSNSQKRRSLLKLARHTAHVPGSRMAAIARPIALFCARVKRGVP